MSVKKIIEEHLRVNGFDGLYSPDGECSCEVGALMPCQAAGIEECRPGFKVACTGDNCSAGGECDWHIAEKRANKPEGGATR